KDFFKPAEPLLLAAPWVMVRGNHENCFGKNGDGWFFLLQPEFGTVSGCPKEAALQPDRKDGPVNMELIQAADRDPDNQPPYALDLSAGEQKPVKPNLRLIVVDSANAAYRCKTWIEDFDARGKAKVETYLESSPS